jgi:hypothetical protein
MRAKNFRNPFSIFGYLLERNLLSKSGDLGPNLGKFSQEKTNSQSPGYFRCFPGIWIRSPPTTLPFPGPGITVPPRSIPEVLKTTTRIPPRVLRSNHGSQLLKTSVPGGQKWNRSSRKVAKGENTRPKGGGDRNTVLWRLFHTNRRVCEILKRELQTATSELVAFCWPESFFYLKNQNRRFLGLAQRNNFIFLSSWKIFTKSQ